jgi:hypothetical protein
MIQPAPSDLTHAPQTAVPDDYFGAMAGANIGTFRAFRTRRFHSKAVNG